MTRTHRAALVVGLLALGALAACGGDDGGSAEQPTSVAPVSTEAPQPTPTSEAGEVPERIVSISPTHTEMLFAIGAGDQVVAVDSLSNYPPEAADVLTDLSAFEPNVEAIAGYEPDLVVISDDFTGLTDQLAAVDIPVWSGPAAADFDDVYEQILDLGQVTGHVSEAEALVADMRARVDEILASAPSLDEPLTYYHELDETYYSVTSNTFIGHVYGLLGLRNIADMAEGTTDYPQLSAEFIVSTDPDLIFLACSVYCGTTAESVAARPGWGSMTAVVNGHIFEMDDDVASRWGPRVVDYLEAVAAAVSDVVAVPA